MSEFTTEGRPELPNLVAERELFEIHWRLPSSALSEKIAKYALLLASDLMPRAEVAIEEIQRHLIFERDYRCGDFEKGEI